MEEETKKLEHYDTVEGCIGKLIFLSEMFNATFRAGTSPQLSNNAMDGLDLICREMIRQLSPVATYLQDSA